jgi:hypothetical protein
VITPQLRAEMRMLVLRDGWKIETVARHFGVHHSVVRRAIADAPAEDAPDPRASARRFRNQWTASPKLGEARVAIFAPGAVMYGLNRMFQLMRDSERLAVFRDREKALLWLRSST